MNYIYTLFLLCSCSEAAKILAYIQLPHYSHQAIYRPLWKELARRGHEITLLTTDLMEDTPNITQVDLSGAYGFIEKYSYFELYSNGSYFSFVIAFLNMFLEIFDYELSHPEVRKIIKGETKFDLIIAEILATPIPAAFSKKLNAPFIGVTSMDGHFHAHELVGNPVNPILYPSYDVQFSENFNLKDRLLSSLFCLIGKLLAIFFTPIYLDNLFLKHFNETTGSVDATAKNISMLFINADPIFNNPRPLSPQTVNIGGYVHIGKPKSIAPHLKEFLEKSTQGVIYFSLGTNIGRSQLSNQSKMVILETFSKLRYSVIWKFDEDFDNKLQNVRIEKWFPQQDILPHKNLKLFVTQGGLQSIEEAVFNRIPMIAIPFFGDQFSNAQKMVVKGFGLKIDHHDITVEEFNRCISEVIENPKYKMAIEREASIVLDQPMTGLEKAVWWTEYVIRHNGAHHLKNTGLNLPFYQRYLLDVTFIITFTLFTFITIWVFIIYHSVIIIRRILARKPITPKVKIKSS